jgi:large subunit ribosomal protein L22
MEAKAVTKYVRISTLKVRQVADVVRGKSVAQALAELRYMPQKAAREVARTVKSAAANAENNFDMDPADLVIKTIYADQGPRLRRYMPRARGRVDVLRKPTTHITVVVDDGQEY